MIPVNKAKLQRWDRFHDKGALAMSKVFTGSGVSSPVRGANRPARNHLLIGLDRPAREPQFAAHIPNSPNRDERKLHFIDSANPDQLIWNTAFVETDLNRTPRIIIPKSDRTRQTGDRMMIAENAFKCSLRNK